jgi:glycerophosphoryl diester phosphodiesterase
MLQVIDRAGMRRRVLIASEHQEPIDELRARAPNMPTNFARRDIAAFLASLPPGAVAYVPRGDALQLPPEHNSWKLVTAESVAAAHRIGVEVHVWTVNDETEMRAFLALGVDGIITDYPSRLVGLLSA